MRTDKISILETYGSFGGDGTILSIVNNRGVYMYPVFICEDNNKTIELLYSVLQREVFGTCCYIEVNRANR